MAESDEKDVAPQPEITEIAEIKAAQTATEYAPEISETALFPHEVPSEHWDVDFSDGEEIYEGTTLPVWLLAGWAIFILWAVIYLVVGLPGSF